MYGIPYCAPAASSKVEENAGQELCTYLNKAYEDDFVLVKEPDEGNIYVGYTAFLPLRRAFPAKGGCNP